MQPTVSRFSGAYWWSVQNQTLDSASSVTEVPKTIVDLLKDQTQATAIELTNQYKGLDSLPKGDKVQRLILTNDSRGQHLPAESSLNPNELFNKLRRYINNPHGILFTTTVQGENPTLKEFSPIQRFFKSIGNFFKRLFGSK